VGIFIGNESPEASPQNTGSDPLVQLTARTENSDTISDISDMSDALVRDAALLLIEAFVWLVVPLAFFLSLICPKRCPRDNGDTAWTLLLDGLFVVCERHRDLGEYPM
jgi:hypothetical protein